MIHGDVAQRSIILQRDCELGSIGPLWFKGGSFVIQMILTVIFLLGAILLGYYTRAFTLGGLRKIKICEHCKFGASCIFVLSFFQWFWCSKCKTQ